MLCAVTAKAQEIPNPEPVRDQKAVYDAAANTVTLTGRAPSKTEYDWEWSWTDYPLDHISYISIFRHERYTGWPSTELTRIEAPEVGKDISYVDATVEKDKNYEYKFIVNVDGKERHPAR